MTYAKKIKIAITFIMLAIIAVASPFNAKAAELGLDVSLVDIASNPQFGVRLVGGNWSKWWRPFKTGSLDGNQQWITGLVIDTGKQWGINQDSYIEVSMTMSNFTRAGVNLDVLMSQTATACTDFNVVDLKMNTLSDQTGQIKIIFKTSSQSTLWTQYVNVLSKEGGNCAVNNFIYLWQDTTFSINYIAHYKVKTSDTTSVVNAINNQTTNEVNAINNINNTQQQAGEQAQGNGQQGADQSQDSVNQGTQSLLSAITGFVGVISNATPTNCRITGDMGALDLGQLDFCQDNPPAIITTIGTLILIAITIPITIWVVKKIISLFRSFTNG